MEQLVNFIIRPPRADYSPIDDLLDQEFMLKGRWYQRKDLEIKNSRGHALQCSHYGPAVIPEGKTLPCVIYCHGNSGCRADASEAAIILLPSNITVFTLDFSGSGLSGGEHVTLGWNEKEDLKAVVNYLRAEGNVSCIGLWGRSMGAVTSLMYGAEDPSIAGMVLDSPFSNLVDLMMELVDTYRYPLPKFTVKLAIQHMRKVIKKKANFDIMDLDTIQVAKCCFVPVLLGHATDDDFICPRHSDRIYESYVGDKNIIKFDGDHNSPRPQFYFDSITIFFHNVLSPPSDEQYFHTMHDFHDKDIRNGVPAMGYGHHGSNGSHPELASGSTEDAISQLRSRRPMSRTEVPSDISSQEKQDEPEGNGADGPSSSSRLFSDALPSNGHSLSPVDDEYVEYSFDNFSDIPSSMEDEERMIMEAIMESLKDMEPRHPQGDAHSNIDTTPNLPTSNGTQGSVSEANEPAPEPENNMISTSSKLESSATPAPITIRPCATNESSTNQEVDTSDGTRATLVVQKNPSSHVIEGLAHRWSLNFFKSKR
ncbi:uncharacterized protein LOC109842856 isoform X2 [Asparagus officinalis]|uniref:uncharacterized protein LOC109842856 isoform X1 n=1 Tax=Asparagus officinalis TaxID=4686 RepID=UPI00098DEDA9|nr:uncharacterized protein LOC109842856 isoform X1 [Asparagus officinalis]XP_020267347.1 uncharacterized protein LOC109842856 isoform X2 [Asparagus officinalis]